MNHLIKTAVETFNGCERYWGEAGKWVSENIAQVMQDIYLIPQGESFPLSKYISDKFGKDKIPLAMSYMMPYLTGGYGVLDLTFETSDGSKAKVGPWEVANEIGKDKIKCISEDGKELSQDEVYVIFRRNARMQIEIPAPYKNFNPENPFNI